MHRGRRPAGDRELTQLAAAWSAAGAGRPAVVLLAGEGGIGKTRLAAATEVLAASDGRALSARCYASERSLFLQGRVDEAVALDRDAVAAVAPHAEHWMRPACAGLLAGSLIEAGEPDEATAVLADARVDRGGAEGYRLRALAPLAEATGSAEMLAEADALLAAISAPPGSAWLLGTDAYLSVARAWLARGEPGRARAVLAPLLGAARRLGWIPALATGGLVDARAARG